jgi:NADH:ubiquinone oxidoreductase subunit K
MLTLFIAAILMVFIVGFYSLIVTRSLIRVVVALEVVAKGATLLTIVAGAVTGQMARAEVFVIMMIIIEVIVTAVAAGLIIGVFNHTGVSLTSAIVNLKENPDEDRQ